MQKRLLFLSLLTVLLTNKTYSQTPINDHINNAITLTLGNTEDEYKTNVPTLKNATVSTNDIPGFPIPDSSCISNVNPDLWYITHASEEGNLIVQVSVNSSVITIYTGTPDNLHQVACKYTKAQVSGLESNQPVYVRYSSRVTYYDFDIQAYSFTPPVNNNILNAINLKPGTNENENVVVGTMSDAAPSTNDIKNGMIEDPTCGYGYEIYGGDVWYTTIVPASGNISILVKENGITDSSTIYSGTPENLVEIKCGTDGNSVTLLNRTPNEKLYIRVWQITESSFKDFEIVAFDPIIPSNDNINNAITLKQGSQKNEYITNIPTTENATESTNNIPTSDCYTTSSKHDLWYTTTASEYGNIVIKVDNDDISSPNYNPIYLKAYTGTLNNLTEVGCYAHTLAISDLKPNETVYIRLWTSQYNIYVDSKIQAYSFPINDNINNAKSLTVGSNKNTNIVGGTVEYASDSTNDLANTTIAKPSCESTYSSGDVWYTATVPESGNISISLHYNSNTSEYATIYSGTPDNLIEISTCTQDGSTATLRNRKPNETLYIRVWQSSEGYITKHFIIVAFEPIIPKNDEIINATELTLGSAKNEYITNTPSTENASNNISNTSLPTPDCFNLYVNADLWYTVNAPINGTVIIETDNRNIYLAAYTGTPNDLTLIGCSTNAKITLSELNPNEEIYIRIFPAFGSYTNFNIQAYSLTTPSNDNINNAIELIVGTTATENILSGTNENATDSANDIDNYTIPNPSCGYGYNGGDVWYKAAIPETGILNIYTTYNSPSYITLYSGNINNLIEIGCETDGNTYNLKERTPNETIYIRVWEANNYPRSISIVAYTDFPPINDNIASAIELTVGTNSNENIITGTNQHATDSADDIENYTIPIPNCGYGYNGGDIWYKVTIPNSGNLTIFTTSGSLDYITLYSGAIDDLIEIGCKTDGNRYHLNDRTIGETIYIRAWENSNYTRTINITAYEPLVPFNDNINNAIELTVGTNPNENIVTGTNEMATASANDISDYTIPDPFCADGYTSGDVWYTATVPDSGNLTILSTSGSPDYITLYSGATNNLIEIGCGTDGNKYNLTNRIIGETIYIRVWESNNYTVPISISAFEPVIPENDNIANATVLTVGTSATENIVVGTNENATESANDVADYTIPSPDCGYGYNGGDVWYKAIIPSSGNLIIFTTYGSPSYLTLYSGIINDLTEIGCGSDGYEYKLINRIAGETIYIRVWESYNDTKPISISAYKPYEPVLPQNDNISNAIELTTGTSPTENIVIGTNDNATPSANDIVDYTIPDPSCSSRYDGGDIWYKAVVPNSGNLTIYTNYGSLDYITLYSGTINNLVEIGCGTDGDEYKLSNRTADETIYIRAWGTYNNTKSISISAFELEVPENDNIINATELTVGASATKNIVNGTNVNATPSANDVTDYTIADPTCRSYYYGGDVWYKVTVPSSGNLTIFTNYGSPDYITLYSGTINNLVEIGCGTDGNEYKLTNRIADETLYIRVWSPYNDTGSISISAFEPLTPENDNIANAIELTIGTILNENSVVGSINNSSNSSNDLGIAIPSPSCSAYSNFTDDVWYKVIVPINTTTLTIETTQYLFNKMDSGIAIYSGDINGTLSLLECNDDKDNNNYSKINLLDRTPSETLYVRVWDYRGAGSAISTFLISVYGNSDITLDNTTVIDVENLDFKYFINQNDQLILKTSNNIDNVSIYSLSGKKTNTPRNNSNTEIDISSLSSGIYFINVIINGKSRTFKIVK